MKHPIQLVTFILGNLHCFSSPNPRATRGRSPPPGDCPSPRPLLPCRRRRTRRAKPRWRRWRRGPLLCAVVARFSAVALVALPRELAVSAARRRWWRPPAWWTRPASCWPGILSDLRIWRGWSLRAQSSFDSAVELQEFVRVSEGC
jgi:hypothetical protein